MKLHSANANIEAMPDLAMEKFVMSENQRYVIESLPVQEGRIHFCVSRMASRIDCIGHLVASQQETMKQNSL
jgi:hypothetical protein